MLLKHGGPYILALLAAVGLSKPAAAQDTAPTVRRIATTVELAAQEYRLGVENGHIVAPAEVEESKLFLSEARRSAGLLPHEVGSDAIAEVDQMLALVGRTGSPDSLDRRGRSLTASLTQRLGVSLEPPPAQAPSLSRGAAVYGATCTSCHGQFGRGDGPLAATINPPPGSLADTRALRDRSPLDFYHRVTIGVVGTAMPAFERSLAPEDRWAVALYASTLRLPAPSGRVPPALQGFGRTASMSDAQVIAAIDPARAPDAPGSAALVAAVRTIQPPSGANQAVFVAVRAQLDTAIGLARAGQGEEAGSKAFDAYMTFEQVERAIRAKNPGLATQLEASFAALRSRAVGGAQPQELASIRSGLLAQLENAERTVSDPLSPLNLFVQSFVLLLREGLEAILVVGALMTFLAKTGAARRKRDIHIGVGAAIGASLLTALVMGVIIEVTPASREALEGGTMILATGLLFYVSYWLLSKMEVAKWNRFVKGKVQDALTSGSALALASVAFLAVYREGFETVLFYQALLFTGGSAAAAAMPVFAGIAAGSVVLVAVYLAINRFGVKIPLKPFFAITSAFLYYMAFVFAGKGIAELQEGGLVSTTIIGTNPRVPALGIYPTVESLALQGVLALALVFALAWTFIVEPRRLAVSPVLVPEPLPAPPGALAAAEQRPLGDIEVTRSLERMEADLAEVRAELERLRDRLAGSRTGQGNRL